MLDASADCSEGLEEENWLAASVRPLPGVSSGAGVVVEVGSTGSTGGALVASDFGSTTSGAALDAGITSFVADDSEMPVGAVGAASEVA